MPVNVIKKVWDYCSYSKSFLIFIFFLFLISQIFQNKVYVNVDGGAWMILQAIVFIIVSGYGMEIARDRINHGVKLPKIIVKDVIVLGFKASVVIAFYVIVQTVLLYFITPMDFPFFNLEELLVDLNDTINTLSSHRLFDDLIFVVAGGIIFYCTTFFMEIALAKLADTGKFSEAFNFSSIRRSISALGWWEYAKEYTMIILAIVILTYLKFIDIPFWFIDVPFDLLMGILIFATQFLGIGAIYSKMKDIETNMDEGSHH